MDKKHQKCLKNGFNDFDAILLLNSPYWYLTPRKSRMSWFKLYSSGQTPFLRLGRFLTFLCDTTLWQSDAVVWTTWNLDRICARYSYLKLKNSFQNFISKNVFQFFFKKKFFITNFFSKIFFRNKFGNNKIWRKTFLKKNIRIFFLTSSNYT